MISPDKGSADKAMRRLHSKLTMVGKFCLRRMVSGRKRVNGAVFTKTMVNLGTMLLSGIVVV